MDSDSDNEHSSANEQTPSMAACTAKKNDEVCVGCIASAFVSSKKMTGGDNGSCKADADMNEYRFGASSLPATLKKYRSYSSHHHPATVNNAFLQPHKKAGNGKTKQRAPLTNILNQSTSMNCDNSLVANAATTHLYTDSDAKPATQKSSECDSKRNEDEDDSK